MIKINRALKKAKLSVIDINEGEQKIAEKNINFLCDGKQIYLTLKVLYSANSIEGEFKIEIVVWDSVSKISGKCVKIEDIHVYLPQFNSNHPLFFSEIERIKKRIKPNKNIYIESGIAKSNYLDIYPDK